MPKIIPIVAAKGRHTLNDTLEICFTGIDGKEIIIALTPSYADKVCEVFQHLQGRPDTTAIATLPGGSRKILKNLVKGEPLRSGGYRVSADQRKEEIYLQVAQPDQTEATIPLDVETASRLIDQLLKAVIAVRPPAGSA